MAAAVRNTRYHGKQAVNGSLAYDLDYAVRERALRHAGEAPKAREKAKVYEAPRVLLRARQVVSPLAVLSVAAIMGLALLALMNYVRLTRLSSETVDLQTQLQELETEYNARLDEALDGLTDTAFQSGADTARGLIEGLASQEEALYAKARAMEQEVARIWKDAWKDIPSNAEIAASLNPEAMRTEPPATETGVRRSISAGVNGLLTAFPGIGAAPATAEGAVYLDGQQVGRIMLPGLRAEARANPEVVDDT